MLFGHREPRICCFLIKAQSDQKEKNISRDIYHSRMHLAISAPCSSPWPSSAWSKEGCRTLAQGHLPVVPRPLEISGLILQHLQQKTQRRHFCTSQVSWGRGWSALWAENFWEFTSQKYWKLLSKTKAGVTVRLRLATPSPFSEGSSRGWHLGDLGTGESWEALIQQGDGLLDSSTDPEMSHKKPKLSALNFSHHSFASSQCKSINKKISRWSRKLKLQPRSTERGQGKEKLKQTAPLSQYLAVLTEGFSAFQTCGWAEHFRAKGFGRLGLVRARNSWQWEAGQGQGWLGPGLDHVDSGLAQRPMVEIVGYILNNGVFFIMFLETFLPVFQWRSLPVP